MARYYRDAKIMEIIEGSCELQQITIAAAVCRGAGDDPGRGRPAGPGEVRGLGPGRHDPGRVLLEDDRVVIKDHVVDAIRQLDDVGILHSISSKNDHDLAMARLEKAALAGYFSLAADQLEPEVGFNPAHRLVAQHRHRRACLRR